jgi:hypothetical protein
MGMEKLESITATNINQETPQNRPYFEQTNNSKEFLAAKRFTEKYIDTGIFTELTDSPENIEAMSIYIQKLGNRLIPGVVVNEVISELRAAGVITPVVVEKNKKEKPVEFLETEYVSLQKPKQLEIDEQQQQIIETNLLYEELEKANIFKNQEELESIYKLTEELQKNHLENNEHYYEFANLVKGGTEEIRGDLESLAVLEQGFETAIGDPTAKERQEYAKKIATITERAFAHAITTHEWFGKNVSVEPVSKFDDVKRGVDDMLEIRKEDEESGFLALAIDVTFRGLESEQFKQKFFKLLQSVADGHKTKVKYFKNHTGVPMKEFAVPKMVLYFNTNDVKEMVEVLKHPDRAAKSSQKDNVLNQILDSCEILAGFAEEYQNSVFRRYVATINSFKELAWENNDVKRIIDSRGDSKVKTHLKALVVEFKLNQEIKANAA